MNLTLEFLYSLRNQGSRFGIDRMKTLCQALNHPQFSYPSIHVAGTNGKGSVCTMLDSVYRAHGYRVGLFTSPHLINLGERIKINGRTITFAKIEYWVQALMPLCMEMEKKDPEMKPTFFELMTVIAFLEFKKQKVDLAIFETGLGGRLDSTNVLDPEVSVITTVGYDHCEILGDEIRKIAAEKAGIIKPGKPVVVGWLDKDAHQEVIKVSKNQKSLVYDLSLIKHTELPKTNLQGSFQKKNAAVAKKTVEVLKSSFPVDEKIILKALQEVDFPGRWQLISEKPTIILDACHNGHGAEATKELWNQLPSQTEVWFAACGEDRAREVLCPLLERTTSLVLFSLNQPRACTHQQLKKIARDFCGTVRLAGEEEIPQYFQNLDPDSTILVTGSIYLVSSVLSYCKENTSKYGSENWQDYW